MTPQHRTLPALVRLVNEGVLTPEESANALTRAARDGRNVDEVLREIRPDFPVPRTLGYRYLDLADIAVDRAAVALVPEALARNHGALPVCFDGDRLVVALSDPTNVIALDDLRTVTGWDLDIVLAEPSAIDAAWLGLETLDGITSSLVEDPSRPRDEVSEAGLDAAQDAPIVRAINQIIAQGIQQGASDIHIEPHEHDMLVRFRLDGVLHDVTHIPRSFRGGVSSRLKIMAELDISERRIPQDGRLTVTVGGQHVDLRIATVPSVWGEEVILRILDRSALLTLTDIGFSEATRRKYERAFLKPHGAILVVGPTGSGKSTTLYSTLSTVNDISRKIITVEDPVELRLPRVTQIHVNQKAGLSFATALRSILRSDPDVVMIGEIRDSETARIAIEAAMTGHLVFSTLHTNDAPTAVTRLLEMGLEPFLVASAIEGVLAQRLARRLCARCKAPYSPEPQLVRNRGIEADTLYRAVGCKSCAGTGYRGRIALVELMLMSEEIERLTVERRPADEIRRTAIGQGMQTLREDGITKVEQGLTSLEEMLRVLEGGAQPGTPEVEDLETNGEHVVPLRRAMG